MKKSMEAAPSRRVRAMYRRLLEAFGPQGWWPADSPFEVAVGAILTQNTNWKNVERALANLAGAGALSPGGLFALSVERVAELIRPAGYFNVKSVRLRSFLEYLERRHGLDMERLAATPRNRLRKELLSVHGIGPETADSIILYACGRLSFVVDAYTRRIACRHGLCPERASYDSLQRIFTAALPQSTEIYNEFHALIVKVGKEFCRPAAPRCGSCPLDPPAAG